MDKLGNINGSSPELGGGQARLEAMWAVRKVRFRQAAFICRIWFSAKEFGSVLMH